LPCMMLLNSIWYRREEQPLRTAFWYNTFAGVFGGILSYAIGKIDGPLSTWRYVFLIYGAVTVFCGGLFVLLMPDSPSKAWFFTAQEKELAVVRLASNQTGIESKKVCGRLIKNNRDGLHTRLANITRKSRRSSSLRYGRRPEILSAIAYGFAR
jgi:MFS family permease